MDTIFADLAGRGFAVIADALIPPEVEALCAAAEQLPTPSQAETRAGVRDLFTHLPATRELARHPAIAGWPAAILGPRAFAVRALLFDKTPAANWRVAWHQDLTIPARERRDVPGFGPWSEKGGIPHVQPPAEVLDRMLTVRVHLDTCQATNGPLRVLPGTHRHGKLSAAAIDACRAGTEPVSVLLPAGGLLLMRPLLLHASSPAQLPGHRRVIHLEYAVDPLPGGLQWQEQWRCDPEPPSRTRLTRLGRRLAPV
jgi:Phytanoyl-CoA dioxygenase (PhyH)